jgi:hypothetical protein
MRVMDENIAFRCSTSENRRRWRARARATTSLGAFAVVRRRACLPSALPALLAHTAGDANRCIDRANSKKRRSRRHGVKSLDASRIARPDMVNLTISCSDRQKNVNLEAQPGGSYMHVSGAVRAAADFFFGATGPAPKKIFFRSTEARESRCVYFLWHSAY